MNMKANWMSAGVTNPWEAWRFGWTASELWATSAYNIMSRTNWLSTADPTQGAALREWQRMWSEKAMAGLEVAAAMQRAGFDLWFGRFNPWHSGRRVLNPLHRRTVANSRRLARRDRTAG
jgi:hypothetical protein